MRASLLLPSALLVLVHMLACTGIAPASSRAEKRPHLVIALADDLGWNDLEGFGGGNRMQSPQISDLAAEGIRLTSWYVFKFCSPSRSQTLTGRFAYHLGQQTELNLNPQTGCEWDSTQGRREAYMCTIKCGLSLKYKMLPALLKEQGFKTHALGKWHQGFFRQEYTPTYRGFDTYFGSYTNNDHFTHVDPYGHQPKACPWWTPAANDSCPMLHPCPNAHTLAPDGSCHNCLLNDLTNNSNITGIANAPLTLNGTYSARLKSQEAARLIAAHDISAPFFLYCAFTVVHDPAEAPAESIARYDDTITWPHRKIMGGMVWELDSTVGTIANALKERDMWKNTLLWFSTDNGSPLSNGGNNAPLRGSKMTDWEGGVRGVAFISGGLVPADRRNSSWGGLCSQVDLYATLGNLAGVPEGSFKNSGPVPPDSIDIWPALLSGGASPRTELVHNINGNWSGGLRIGAWKLLWGSPNEAGRGVSAWSTDTPWNTTQHPPDEDQEWCVERPCLFEVGGGVDPDERNDLAEGHPAKVQEMLVRRSGPPLHYAHRLLWRALPLQAHTIERWRNLLTDVSFYASRTRLGWLSSERQR